MPGEMGIGIAELGEEGVLHVVAEAGFIGEEAQERLAEVFLQLRIMGLVHVVHKDLYGFRSEHIAVMGAEVIQTALGLDKNDDPPVSFGQVKPHKPVLKTVGYVQNVTVILFVGNMTAGKDGNDLILRCCFPAIHQGKAVRNGAGYVDMPLRNAPGAQMGKFFPTERIVGGTGGEVLVVQNPHTHALFPAVVHDQTHIGPPFLPAEILVGTGFQADGADAAVINAVQFPDDQGVVLAMEPQEGCHVVVLLALQVFL